MNPKRFESKEEPKTENISIRIDKEVLDKLRKYARMENSSINSEIVKLLTFDVDWSIVATKSGWIPVPRNILIAIMDKLDDKEVVAIAEGIAKKTLRDLVLSMTGNYTVKGALDVLGGRSRAAGFHYDEVDGDDEIHFVMQHNMGQKWSLYFTVFYESALRDLGCATKFTMTDNTITYTVKKSDYK